MNRDGANIDEWIKELGSVAKQSRDGISDPNESLCIDDDTSHAFDYYSEITPISAGGVKQISRAKETRSGRFVALAQLKEDQKSHARIDGFLREARILASLEHPSIVPLYEINLDKDKLPYFTMKLLKGETLAKVLAKLRKGDEAYLNKYTIPALLDLFIKVCDAIAYAHSKSIVHLDLKPENIYLDDYGETIIIDWGMAKYTSAEACPDDSDELNAFTPVSMAITDNREVAGTPAYMAPEQVTLESKTGEASDIYALGMILYGILTLRKPFEGFQTADILTSKKKGLVPEIIHANKQRLIPQSLKAVIEKATQTKPESRYANANEIRDEVQNYLLGFATQAEEPSLFKLLTLSFRRHRKLILTAVAGLALMTLTGALSWNKIQKERILKNINLELAKTSQRELQQSIERQQAVTEQTLRGIRNEDNRLRNEYDFKEAQARFERYKQLNYKHPSILYLQARHLIGELRLAEALHILKSLSYDDLEGIEASQPNELQSLVKYYYDLSRTRMLNPSDISDFASKLEGNTPIQKHIIFRLNQRKNFKIEEKLELLKENLLKFNPGLQAGSLNIEYRIGDRGINLNLNNNPSLENALPIIGLPLESFRISNTQVQFKSVSRYVLKNTLKVDINGTPSTLSRNQLISPSCKSLDAKRLTFFTNDLTNLTALTHLDIKGAEIPNKSITLPSSIEWADLSHTNISTINNLNKLTELKTLIIDNSLELTEKTLNQIRKQGATIEVTDTR